MAKEFKPLHEANEYAQSVHLQQIEDTLASVNSLASPNLWNAFVRLNGCVIVTTESDSTSIGDYSSSTTKEQGKIEFNPVYRPLMINEESGSSCTHELAHFIDDKAPLLAHARQKAYDEVEIGLHSENSLWALISEAETRRECPETKAAEAVRRHYEQEEHAAELFATSAEFHLVARKPRNTSPLIGKYFQSIVNYDVALCLQDKPHDDIFADRLKFKNIIESAVDKEFKDDVTIATKRDEYDEVNRLITGKIDAIIKQAKKELGVALPTGRKR